MRRGLGKGLGMGYKNIVPVDPHIHSLSAKGVKSKVPMKSKSPQETARMMVADGKTPNKYWVSVGEDYYYFNDETGGLDWVSDKYTGYKFKGKTLKMFNTFEEAKEYADSIALNEKIDGVKVKNISIEDRLSGQVYEKTQQEEGGVFESSDIKFTKETEQKRGVKSTIAKPRPKTNPVNESNVVDYIMKYEGGEPTNEEVINLFSYLIKTGRAWRLQGMYGRQAQGFIDAGLIDKTGKINWSEYENATLNAKRGK